MKKSQVDSPKENSGKIPAGIVGGMGPLATASFLRRVVELTGAESDQEHIPAIIVNATRTPDRTRHLLEETHGEHLRPASSPLPSMLSAASCLEAAGCKMIAIPCNTAHLYLDELRAACDIPILSMVDATMEACDQYGFSQVLIMGTEATAALNLYGVAGERLGISCNYPSPSLQKRITAMIATVKSGRADTGVFARLMTDAAVWGERVGVEAMVVACTELSAVLHDPVPTGGSTLIHDDFGLPTVDAMDVLAMSLIKQTGYPCRIREAKPLRSDHKDSDRFRGPQGKKHLCAAS